MRSPLHTLVRCGIGKFVFHAVLFPNIESFFNFGTTHFCNGFLFNILGIVAGILNFIALTPVLQCSNRSIMLELAFWLPLYDYRWIIYISHRGTYAVICRNVFNRLSITISQKISDPGDIFSWSLLIFPHLGTSFSSNPEIARTTINYRRPAMCQQ